MAILTKKRLEELVGGDITAGGNDRNPTNDSEIETGPMAKSFDDKSDYEKGQATTTDRVFSRYRQNIPWFAVYSYGGTRSSGSRVAESRIVKKKSVEEKIEDLVKKSKVNDVTDKNYDPKVDKIAEILNDADFNDKQLSDLEKMIKDKIKSIKLNKTI